MSSAHCRLTQQLSDSNALCWCDRVPETLWASHGRCNPQLTTRYIHCSRNRGLAQQPIF
jgi:hypothetical protein